MNNPYASPQYAPPPAGGFGMGPGDQMYRGQQQDAAHQATEAAVDILRQTKPWVTFLGVMGFIGAGFMLLGGLAMIVMGAVGPRGTGSTAALGVVYIPLAFVYIYPALKLWGYSGAIGRLLTSRSTFDLEQALAQQKSFWKFAGIMTIVMLVMYLLFFVGMLVVGIGAASLAH